MSTSIEKPTREVLEFRRCLPEQVEAFKKDGWQVAGATRFSLDGVNVLLERPVTPAVAQAVTADQQRRFLVRHVADLRKVAWLLDDDVLHDVCMKLSRACYGDSGSDEAHELEAVVLVKRIRSAQ